MLDKNTNAQQFQTTVGYIFSNYVHCDLVWYLIVSIPDLCTLTNFAIFSRKISALICFLDGFGIVVLVFSY